MITYQEFLNYGGDIETNVYSTVSEYLTSDEYIKAKIAFEYAKSKNVTIITYKKLLYTATGKAVPDNYSANHKCASNFFNRFVTQEVQYLLGNGANFENDNTKEKLGGAKFDTQLQKLAKSALIGAVSYGFYNFDHINIFDATEFCPLFDEENGALMAGIRFWQLDINKPLRMTLYEIDGYSEFIEKNGKIIQMQDKKTYKQSIVKSIADGTTIYDGENYPTFPIVPLYANPYHQSELTGLREQIDAYDLIKSGFANDLDDASMIYWIIQGGEDMDDLSLAQFLERMKTVKAAALSDGATAESHTIDIPYQSRETYLTRLENDMYNDAMALNVNQIAAGNVTATAIEAAYEPLNSKCDQFEYMIDDFIEGLLQIIGIEDTVTFKRSQISNQQEQTQIILAAAQYLDSETILKHLPFLSPDEVEGILDRTNAEEAERYADIEKNNNMEDEEK